MKSASDMAKRIKWVTFTMATTPNILKWEESSGFATLAYLINVWKRLVLCYPFLKLNTDYIKPAKYDDLLTLKTTLIKEPSVRIEFNFELFNEQKELLTKAYCSLVFIDMKKNRPTKAPNYILEKVTPLF